MRVAYGQRHLIVSGHPLASLAGFEVLEQGGSVVDAAIAAAAVLAVVLPQACTIGGDAFMLIHRAGEGTFGLNGSGRCPTGVAAKNLTQGVPERGPDSAVVPTVVRAWHDAHRRFGRLAWARLFERAIGFAGEGFAVSEDLARSTRQYRELLAADPECMRVFLRDGGLEAGALWRQSALGRTLARIAREGPSAFYEGEIPAAIAAAAAARGGALEACDFLDASSEWVKPLTHEYGGHTVTVMPPNSYGLLLLLQLDLVSRDGLDWSKVTDDERLESFVRAWHRAYAAGGAHIADPAVVEAAREVDVAAIAERAAVNPIAEVAAKNPGGTAIVSVADRDGNGVVLVQSVFRAWGAVLLDPHTGVLLNNRGSGFNNIRDDPNCIAPGKRPPHTLCPAMVFANGAPRFLAGSPGGVGQTITLAQVLTNALDRRMNLADAVAAPRITSDLEGRLVVESTVPAETIARLAARGHALAPAQAGIPYFGSAQLVEFRDNGVLAGATDHRREDALLAH